MKTAILLNKARKALQTAQAQTLVDEKAARIAKETAQAAKIKLKYARKIAKLARKAAKNARQKVAESVDVLNRARKKLKKLQKWIAHERQKARAARKDRHTNSRRKRSRKNFRNSLRSKAATRRTAGPKRHPPRKVAGRRTAPMQKSLPLPETRQPDIPKPPELQVGLVPGQSLLAAALSAEVEPVADPDRGADQPPAISVP